MKAYNQLWKNVVDGLVSQGYTIWGGNDNSFLILKDKHNRAIKIFLIDYDNTEYRDSNQIIVRFS